MVADKLAEDLLKKVEVKLKETLEVLASGRVSLAHTELGYLQHEVMIFNLRKGRPLGG